MPDAYADLIIAIIVSTAVAAPFLLMGWFTAMVIWFVMFWAMIWLMEG